MIRFHVPLIPGHYYYEQGRYPEDCFTAEIAEHAEKKIITNMITFALSAIFAVIFSN